MRPARFTIPIVIGLGGLLFYVAHQNDATVHFGIGRWDGAFVSSADDFYPSARMTGPVRHADGSVEVQEFVARLTKRTVRLKLPYHALKSPLRVRVRCHRFGLGGTVRLDVNGEHVEDFVFTESSYPWAGIRTVIPERVAEKGPLRLQLRVTGGASSPEHLPDDLGIGLDWIEVEPMSSGVVLRPTVAEWVQFGATIAFAVGFLAFVRARPNTMTWLLGLLVTAVSAVTWLAPTLAFRSLTVFWIGFPVAIACLWFAELLERTSFPSTVLHGDEEQ